MANYQKPAPSARRRLAPSRRAMAGRRRTPAMNRLQKRLRGARRKRLGTS